MTFYGVMPEYGQNMKPWQKLYKEPLYHYYEDARVGNACVLLVSMRFFRVASGVKGRYTLHKYYRRVKVV
jgi:hypothetical protein